MTATVSTTRNRTMGYFLYRLKSHKTAVIMSCIFGFLAYPLCAITSGMYLSVQSYDATNSGNYDTRNFYEAFGEAGIVIMCIALFAFVALAYGSAVRSFNYLHDKTVVDMSYSLPLTRTQRFTGDFLAGLCSFTVPYIISSILGFLIILPGVTGSFADGIRNGYYNSSPEAEPIINSVVPQILRTLAECMLAGLIFLIMLYAFTVLISSFCGTMLEASFYPIVVMLLIPAIEALVVWAFYFNTHTIEFQGVMMSAIEHFSPFGTVVAALMGTSELSIFSISSNYGAYIGGTEGVIPISVILCNVVIIAAAVIGAYLSHKSRKVERVGQPFMSRAVYYVYLSMLMFAITSLFTVLLIGNTTSTPLTFMLMIFITLIVYLVIDVATKRGFKKLLSGAVGYVIMVGCSALLTFLLVSSNGFGIDNVIPSADSVSRCSVTIYDNRARTISCTYTDKEAIATVTELNKEYYTDGDYVGYVRVTYYTAFGAQKRSFNLNEASFTEERINKLLFSEECKRLKAPDLQSYMYNSFPDGAKAYARVADPLGNAVQTLDNEKTIALYDALEKDWLAVAPEDLPSPQIGLVSLATSYIINGVDLNDNVTDMTLPILDCYENTLALLADEGITLAPVKYGDKPDKNCDYTLSDFPGGYNSENAVVTGETEDEIQLLNVICPEFLCAGYDYTVSLYVRADSANYYDEYRYAVPREYNDLAKRVIEERHKKSEQNADDYYYLPQYNLTDMFVGTELPYEAPRLTEEKYYSVLKSDYKAYSTAADEAFTKLREQVDAAGKYNLSMSLNGYGCSDDISITFAQIVYDDIIAEVVYTFDGNYFLTMNEVISDGGYMQTGTAKVSDPLDYILSY